MSDTLVLAGAKHACNLRFRALPWLKKRTVRLPGTKQVTDWRKSSTFYSLKKGGTIIRCSTAVLQIYGDHQCVVKRAGLRPSGAKIAFNEIIDPGEFFGNLSSLNGRPLMSSAKHWLLQRTGRTISVFQGTNGLHRLQRVLLLKGITLVQNRIPFFFISVHWTIRKRTQQVHADMHMKIPTAHSREVFWTNDISTPTLLI